MLDMYIRELMAAAKQLNQSSPSSPAPTPQKDILALNVAFMNILRIADETGLQQLKSYLSSNSNVWCYFSEKFQSSVEDGEPLTVERISEAAASLKSFLLGQETDVKAFLEKPTFLKSAALRYCEAEKHDLLTKYSAQQALESHSLESGKGFDASRKQELEAKIKLLNPLIQTLTSALPPQPTQGDNKAAAETPTDFQALLAHDEAGLLILSDKDVGKLSKARKALPLPKKLPDSPTLSEELRYTAADVNEAEARQSAHTLPPQETLNAMLKSCDLDLEIISSSPIMFNRGDTSVLFNDLSNEEKMVLQVFSSLFVAEPSDLVEQKESAPAKALLKVLDFSLSNISGFNINFIKKLVSEILPRLAKDKNIQLLLLTDDSRVVESIGEVGNTTFFVISKSQNKVKKSNKQVALLRFSGAPRRTFFVEGRSDANFYNAIYDILLKSRLVDENNKHKPLVTKRFKPFFEVSSRGGGAVNATKEAIEGFVAAQHRKGDKNPPYSLTDADYKQNNPLTTAEKSVDQKHHWAAEQKEKTKKQLHELKRHSLENYLYDPIMLCSIFSRDELESMIPNHHIKEAIIAVKLAHSAICNGQEHLEQKEGEMQRDALQEQRDVLQEQINIFTETVENECVSAETRDKNKKSMETLINSISSALCNLVRGKRAAVEAEEVKKFFVSNLRKIQSRIVDINNINEKVLSEFLTFYVSNLQKHLGDTTSEPKPITSDELKNIRPDIINKLLAQLCSNIKNEKGKLTSMTPQEVDSKIQYHSLRPSQRPSVYGSDSLTLEVNCGNGFLTRKGHSIEQVFSFNEKAGTVAGPRLITDYDDDSTELSKTIIDRIVSCTQGAANHSILLPNDLINIFVKLNTQARNDANRFYKPSSANATGTTAQDGDNKEGSQVRTMAMQQTKKESLVLDRSSRSLGGGDIQGSDPDPTGKMNPKHNAQKLSEGARLGRASS